MMEIIFELSLFLSVYNNSAPQSSSAYYQICHPPVGINPFPTHLPAYEPTTIYYPTPAQPVTNNLYSPPGNDSPPSCMWVQKGTTLRNRPLQVSSEHLSWLQGATPTSGSFGVHPAFDVFQSQGPAPPTYNSSYGSLGGLEVGGWNGGYASYESPASVAATDPAHGFHLVANSTPGNYFFTDHAQVQHCLHQVEEQSANSSIYRQSKSFRPNNEAFYPSAAFANTYAASCSAYSAACSPSATPESTHQYYVRPDVPASPDSGFSSDRASPATGMAMIIFRKIICYY